MKLPVTIAITTKNRQESMARTVAALARFAADAAELLVVDDGSRPRIEPSSWGPLPFEVRLLRHERPGGYIVSRNELARECRTPFLLSCDDDSFPTNGGLESAVRFLEARSDLLALSFPYTEGQAKACMNPSQQPTPYRVRQFIGCAHLMHLTHFRELGGYWEWLIQQNEERELCYRALTRGWHVMHFPGLSFHHDYTPEGRNWNRHDYFTMRNEMAVELRHAPVPIAAAKLARNAALAAALSVRRVGLGAMAGYFAGLASSRPAPARLAWSDFRALQRLRWS